MTSMSNFSIDHILNRAGQKTCASIHREEYSFTEPVRRESAQDFPPCQNMAFQNEDFHRFTFQWLNCTRYHPPKLQRGHKKEGAKRQPGRHPRIPFTAAQIETLEISYKRSAYLNSDEVVKLSSALDLSDTRIKIWFQNRRAREKREKTGSPDCPSHVTHDEIKHEAGIQQITQTHSFTTQREDDTTSRLAETLPLLQTFPWHKS